MEECGDRSEADPRSDSVDDPTKHEVKLKLKLPVELLGFRIKQISFP